MSEKNVEALSQSLKFRPWPQGDPAAPWLIDILDRVQIARLASVELELNKTILEAQLKAIAHVMEIVKTIK